MSDIVWTSAAPLWAENNSNTLSTLNRPTILRFANDSFMDEFANLLASQPARLADYQAWPETWRDPLPEPAAITVLPPALREFQRKRLGNTLGVSRTPDLIDYSDTSRALKLYQPAHQRYYLLTSSLVCRQVGLPDHAINTSAQEKTSFVLRRLMLAHPESFVNSAPPAPNQAPPGVYDEFAFVNGEWRKVLTEKSLMSGEELNPLFAVCYTQTDGRRRRMFGGLIPVGKREAYMTAKKAVASPNPEMATGNGPDPRWEALLRRIFFDPWDALIGSVNQDVKKINDNFNKMVADQADDDDIAKTKEKQLIVIAQKRLQIQETSWYLLLDLADFLDQHLSPMPNALAAVLNNIVLPDSMKTTIQNVPNLYHHNSMEVAASLDDALSKIRAYKQQQLETFHSLHLETSDEPYKGFGDHSAPWPDFLFPLVDLDMQGTSPNWEARLNFPRQRIDHAAEYEIEMPLEPQTLFSQEVQTLLDGLRETLLTALPPQGPSRLPPLPLAAQISKMSESTPINETGWFVARCVLERPNCFPLPDALISDPTQAFQLAGFFDPDAPARPIRIALPVDTSPAGLRKFDKNTAFIMSDILCGQVNRAKNMGLIDLILSVLPWPLHKDLEMDTAPCKEGGDALGTICSLSIPIITICALILLIIIVSLLDIIFHWIPFFIMCFPIHKFSAKKASA